MTRKRHQLTETRLSELKRAYSQSKKADTRVRYQAVRLYGLGYDTEEIGEITGCSYTSLLRWWREFREEGVDALQDERRGGNHARLTAEQLADENPQIIYACANGRNAALFAACQRALHPDPARQADIYNALHTIAAARGVTMIASITDEATAPPKPAHDEAAQAGDAWAAALAVQGNKQARIEQLATAILPWIRTYEDHHGRSWQDLAQSGNPSHSSSIFWDDITREVRRRELRIADDVLKGAIRQAFTWLEMEAQAAALASTATAPEADPANLELPVSQPSNLASADSQPPLATRSAWPYWEAQGWQLFCDERARKGDPNLTAVHDGSQVATPWLTSEAGVIHWLSSGEPVTHNRYMEVTARMEKADPDQRNLRIAAMLETLRAAVDLIGDYEGITGIHSHSGPLRRAVQPMIEMLERNRAETD